MVRKASSKNGPRFNQRVSGGCVVLSMMMCKFNGFWFEGGNIHGASMGLVVGILSADV